MPTLRLLLLLLLALPSCVPADADTGTSGQRADQLEADAGAEAARPGICGPLTDALAADGLNQAFSIAKGAFRAACNANPAGDNLWKDDPEHDAKLASYCEMAPVFRACFVCEQLSSDAVDDPEHRASFESCREYMTDADDEHAAAIWN